MLVLEAPRLVLRPPYYIPSYRTNPTHEQDKKTVALAFKEW